MMGVTRKYITICQENVIETTGVPYCLLLVKESLSDEETSRSFHFLKHKSHEIGRDVHTLNIVLVQGIILLFSFVATMDIPIRLQGQTSVITIRQRFRDLFHFSGT